MSWHSLRANCLIEVVLLRFTDNHLDLVNPSCLVCQSSWTLSGAFETGHRWLLVAVAPESLAWRTFSAPRVAGMRFCCMLFWLIFLLHTVRC